MTLLQFAATRMAPLFSDLAGAKKAMKHVDTALDRKQVSEAATPSEALVALAVPTAQVKQIVAEPPMTWQGDAWKCGASTTITLVHADGTRVQHACAAGAVIRVAGGLLHFPPE